MHGETCLHGWDLGLGTPCEPALNVKIYKLNNFKGENLTNSVMFIMNLAFQSIEYLVDIFANICLSR